MCKEHIAAMSLRCEHNSAITVRSVLAQWPSMALVARDLRVPYNTVAAWCRRDFVPVKYWERLAKAARSRRLRGVTRMGAG